MFDYLLHQQTLSGPPSWAPIITPQPSGLPPSPAMIQKRELQVDTCQSP